MALLKTESRYWRAYQGIIGELVKASFIIIEGLMINQGIIEE